MKEAMTAKDKAKELVDRFLGITYNWQAAKQCALICVDEILDAVTTIADKKFDFYTEVKQEIKSYGI